MPLKIIMIFFYIVLFFLISSCTEHKINYYKTETPKIYAENPAAYFEELVQLSAGAGVTHSFRHSTQ